MANSTVSLKSGLLRIPGATAASKAAAERCLTQDHQKHHCYFRSSGLHNHLSHHILAAFDMGATPELIGAIYDEERKMQRPVLLDNGNNVPKPGVIGNSNWIQYLGNEKAYGALLSFFTAQAKEHGSVQTVEKFVFSPLANGNGSDMLVRLVAGALHPFIQLGYALEFGCDPHLIGEALAQTAIHQVAPSTRPVFDHVFTADAGAPPASKTGSLLYVVSQILSSPKLVPVLPYDPDAFYNTRRDVAFNPPSERTAELARICALWQFSENPTEQELGDKIEECFWIATLLFSSTGKPGKPARLDFFLMHGLTSALFLPSYISLLPSVSSKVHLLRAWFAELATVIIVRGRPQIDGSLVMGFAHTPLPPGLMNALPNRSPAALGSNFQSINPWGHIIQSAMRAPDSHTTKSIRSLAYAALMYGTTASGKIKGAFNGDGKEYIKNTKMVDGSVFVRTAGIVMKTLGWVDWGEKEGEWDRSALGWDDAWE